MLAKLSGRCVSALLLAAALQPLATYAQTAAPVTIREDAATYTLDNGIVAAMVAKDSGDLVSLRYKDMEMLATFLTPEGKPDLQRDPPGHNPNGVNRGMTDHQYGFWSHDAMGPRGTGNAVAKITVDPKGNNGQRAEVSVKGISKGRFMGTGPGAPQTGQFASDIEIRFTLNAGESGVYTYCIFEHPADYPATSLGEARFCAKLNEAFNWFHAGEKYNKLYPKEQARGEDKYTYTTIQSENPAFGWSSTTKNVGFFCINPSMEYMSGGPTKPEFLGHRDTNQIAAPCVLNYWRSSHYGGAAVDVAAGEHWTKVIGPFLLFVNSGAEPLALYEQAKAQAAKESAKWPYEWVNAPEYAGRDKRVTVKGQLVLNDPGNPGGKLTNLQVGLTHAAWLANPPVVPAGRGPGGPGGPGAAGGPGATGAGQAGPPVRRTIDWQQDAKFYQFWAKGSEDGTFAVPHVVPGTYTLRAFANGVLGELAKADITVEAGKPLDLGRVTWTPVRKGRQVWEIGVANRHGGEFFKGNEYAVMDIALQYAKLFPEDITYTIGKSDFAKDWFFLHVPFNTDANATVVPFSGIRSQPGRAAPRTVVFALPAAPKGKATLRVAICGGGARQVDVAVNGKPAGEITRIIGDGVISRHQIQGMWYEREVAFDAGLLQSGENKLTLTVPGGPINSGVIYDYVRLELDESAP